MAQTNVIPFNFQALRLREACWIDGRPYFTRRAIGDWLGYAHPVQRITSLIKRNPHLSDPQWARVVTLRAADGKAYEHEVYDPVGFQLIVFESRQPKAIEYKVAVARLVIAYLTGTLKPYVSPPPALAPALAHRRHTRERAAAIRAIAASEGWSIATVRRHLHKVESGLPELTLGNTGQRYVWKKWRAVHPRVLALVRDGHRRAREIAEWLQVPRATVYRWIRRGEAAA